MDRTREGPARVSGAALSGRSAAGVPLRRTGPRAVLRRHRWFLAVFAVGAALRVAAMLGYRPALWFPDSYTYVVTALRPSPDLVRPAGYSMFLRLLEPFHSFAVVAFVQHLLGLALGVIVYLVARRAVPPALATVAAAPVLLDAYQIQLEHLLVSDVLFALLVLAAVVVATRREPTTGTGAAVGLLLAAAALTRTVGLPLLVVVAAWFWLRARRHRGRPGRFRPLAALLAAALLPIGGYAAWFWQTHHRVGIIGANGVFLYARTMSFADCAVMRPPGDLAVLCDPRPPALRPPSQEYIWNDDSPLVRLPGITFRAGTDALAARFAVLAIRSQPLDYLASVATELGRTFTWERQVYPTREIYDLYEFPAASPEPPARHPATVGHRLAEREYERGPVRTVVAEPYAGVLRAYQGVARLPGAVLLAVLFVPPVAAAARRLTGGRGYGGAAGWALPWTAALVLLVVPAATAEYDHRYVLPAAPLACLAAAVALRRPSGRRAG